MECLPKLKGNIRLIPFDSSNKDKTYILIFENRRWQVSEFTYDIASLADGSRTLEDIRYELQSKYSKDISLHVISNVFERFFVKCSLLDGMESEEKENKKKSRYLWLRVIIIKSDIIEKFKFLSVLFNKHIVKLLMILSLIIHIITIYKFKDMFCFSYIFQMGKIYNIKLIPFILMVQLAAIFFHELGHLVPAMKYGLKPGNLGGGLYFTSGVLFADISNVWELKRKFRVIVNLGGMYFQYLVLSTAAYISIITNNKMIFIGIIVSEISMLNNLNPFLKLDGYWVVTDLLGISNLHDTSKDFFMILFYKILKIKHVYKEFEFKRLLEKNFFILYSICNYIFVIIFAAGILVGYKSVCSELVAEIIKYEELNKHTLINTLITIKKNIFNIFLFFMFTKIFVTTLIKIIKSFANIYNNIMNKTTA